MKTSYLAILTVAVSTLLMSFSTPNLKWDFLGQRKVNYSLDRDEIAVTVREGAFRKIKLEVKKAPVNFRKVIVHYRNGSTESIEMRDKIPAGGQTRAIDLNGGKRIIKKVVFYYDSQNRSPRKGLVKLYGMH